MKKGIAVAATIAGLIVGPPLIYTALWAMGRYVMWLNTH